MIRIIKILFRKRVVTMQIKKFLKVASLMGMAMVVLVGCSNTETQNETSQQVEPEVNTESVTPQETTSEFPVVIEHAYGETIIEEKPERVVTVAWANQDTALALGVVPVGYSMANFGPVDELGMHEWTAEKVRELGEENPNVFQDVAGIDFEAVSDANPDVILAAYSGLTEDEYTLLSEIAPVVAYPEMPWATYWRDQITINATAMGLKEEGEAYVAEIDTLIDEKRAEHPNLEGVTGAFIWVDATDLSSFYLYTPVDTRAAYLVDLGITFPQELEEQIGTEDFFVTVSAENIDLLNALDILVVYGNETLLETMQADPLFKTVPAVQRGSVALIDEASNIAGAATPSALSIPAVIDDYMDLLSAAADKVQ